MFRKSRIAVVTGSASGIGAATAKLLADRGYRVIGVDLRKADVIADLATPDGRQKMVEQVTRLSRGKLDAIVANAGGGPAETSVQLNYFGAVATLEGLRPLLAKSKTPRAVAVSSIASLRPPQAALVEACLKGDEAAALIIARQVWDEANAGGGAVEGGLALYGNAKYALNRWCRTHAATTEWAGAGILVNMVPLGFYDTPAAAYILQNKEARAAMGAGVPLTGSFPGRPEEAAKLLAFLISPDNTQLTGQILYADGGYEAKARGEFL
ncbi:MAG TPA: SDR family oxidoreductase [Rhizomicrobium sp.]|nr:SDR family oxidoreductase [Rhizomicrobium sp.]